MLRTLRKPPRDLDYLIILGAHVKGTRLTTALYNRCRTGLSYLRENPRTKAVLSGGMGEGERITEAEAMKRYFLKEGISKERLILEGRSTNTKENLDYSLELLGDRDCSIGIVTNHFHVFRGVAIGKKAGCTRIYGIPAPYTSYRLLWYVPREILAIIKDKLMGNL